LQQPGGFQDPVNAAGADGHHVGVQHHERQPPIAFQRMRLGVLGDGAFFPVFQPMVARHQAVVLVGLTVAPLPPAVLARAQFDPAQQPFDRQLGAVGPVADKVHHLVANTMGHPLHG